MVQIGLTQKQEQRCVHMELDAIVVSAGYAVVDGDVVVDGIVVW